MANPNRKMDQISEQPAAGEVSLIPYEPAKLTDLEMDSYMAETPMSGMTLDNPRNDDDIEEIARLNAELLRLRADSAAEQDVIDNVFLELKTVKNELTRIKGLLLKKTSECVDLRSTVAKQKRQFGSLQKHALAKPTAAASASPNQDARIRLLQVQINNLTADLADKDAWLKTTSDSFEKEREEWSLQSTELCTAQRDRDHLRVEYQSAMEENQMLAQEMKDLKEQDIKAREANEESAAESDKKVRELQELVQFFKNNSERLAKETRQLEEQNRALDEKNTIKDRELDDERSANLALKMQAGVV